MPTSSEAMLTQEKVPIPLVFLGNLGGFLPFFRAQRESHSTATLTGAAI
jgi:hypothetical protein